MWLGHAGTRQENYCGDKKNASVIQSTPTLPSLALRRPRAITPLLSLPCLRRGVLGGLVLGKALILEHVHQRRLSGIVQAQEQNLGILVVQAQRVEHGLEPAPRADAGIALSSPAGLRVIRKEHVASAIHPAAGHPASHQFQRNMLPR